MSSIKPVKRFITSVTLTFKTYDFDIKMTAGKSSIWNFIAKSRRNNSQYAVYCVPSLDQAQTLIKVALKKLPKEHKLVVVTKHHTREDLDKSYDNNYCLITIATLNKYGQEMIETRAREAMNRVSNSPDNDVLIDGFTKNKLF